MADLLRSPARTAVVLALAVVALFDVLSLLQGIRSVRRLQARVVDGVQRRLAAARPEIELALARGGAQSWREAAELAVRLELASEVDVVDMAGQPIFSHSHPSPVARVLRPDEVDRVQRGVVLTVAARDGSVVRALSYLRLPFDSPGHVLRLASSAPDLEDELQERQQVFLGQAASLVVLAVAALFVLRFGRPAEPSPDSALQAYEQAIERLRDHGEESETRHAEERRHMEDALREREAMARAGELTAGIAHEFRNGLGTILGYARLLERSGLPEDPQTAARSIREECETLETIVRRFTDFVRLEQLSLAATDLSRLLGRVVAREQRGHEQVQVRLTGLEAPLQIAVDEEMLERAFENVVRNAIQAAGAGGRHVGVTATSGESTLEVRIEDDGPGLAPDHPGEIRPFYTTRPGGLGLGLPFARKIVLLHGGALRLERRAPGGVAVVVTLPAAPLA